MGMTAAARGRPRRASSIGIRLIARCDRGGVAGGASRISSAAQRYLEAGADMIFHEALTSEPSSSAAAREIKGPPTSIGPVSRPGCRSRSERNGSPVSNATGSLRSATVRCGLLEESRATT